MPMAAALFESNPHKKIIPPAKAVRMIWWGMVDLPSGHKLRLHRPHPIKIPTALTGNRYFWWGMVDSNHRRRCQQIYSLSPLATREIPHIKLELVDGFEPPTC